MTGVAAWLLEKSVWVRLLRQVRGDYMDVHQLKTEIEKLFDGDVSLATTGAFYDNASAMNIPIRKFAYAVHLPYDGAESALCRMMLEQIRERYPIRQGSRLVWRRYPGIEIKHQPGDVNDVMHLTCRLGVVPKPIEPSSEDSRYKSMINNPRHAMGFDVALQFMNEDKHVARRGWSGRDKVTWIRRQDPDFTSLMTLPYIHARLIDGNNVPWTPNNIDLLANDWEVVE